MKNICCLMIFCIFIIFCFITNIYAQDMKNRYIFKNALWDMTTSQIKNDVENNKYYSTRYDDKHRYQLIYDDKISGKNCKITYTFDHEALKEIFIVFYKFEDKNDINNFYKYLIKTLNDKYKNIEDLFGNKSYFTCNDDNTNVVLININKGISLKYTDKKYTEKEREYEMKKNKDKIKQNIIDQEKDKSIF